MILNTAEKFLMIAHHPEKGYFKVSQMCIGYGTIGALLLDLAITNDVTFENERLLLRGNAGSSDQATSDIIAAIRSSSKPRKLRYWVSKLGNRPGKYKWAVLRGMEAKKMLRIETKKFLGLIPYRNTYLTETRTRYELIQHLRSEILYHKEINDETVSILGLIEACRMHRHLTSDRDELKTIRKELKQIIKESPIADTIGKTIKEVQAAVIAAVIASSAASTAASSH